MKSENKYENSVIYGIKRNDDLIYIGSTLDFNGRKNGHSQKFKHGCKQSLYCYLRENDIDIKSCEMYIIQKLDLNEGSDEKNRDKLKHIEGEWIKICNPICNPTLPFMENDGRKERKKGWDKKYNETHKEEIKIKRKEYYENSKEIILEKSKEKYKNDEEYREKKKQYTRNVDKEVKKQRDKEYYQRNKEKLNEKVTCPICEKEMNKSSLTRHKKTHI